MDKAKKAKGKGMADYSKTEMEQALKALDSMIERSEKAQAKFAAGTSQHTLQKNRIHALHTAHALIQKELGIGCAAGMTITDFESARKPITSLIGKSEKAIQKLRPGSWQHTMLQNNLQALDIALPLLAAAAGAI